METNDSSERTSYPVKFQKVGVFSHPYESDNESSDWEAPLCVMLMFGKEPVLAWTQTYNPHWRYREIEASMGAYLVDHGSKNCHPLRLHHTFKSLSLCGGRLMALWP